MEEEEEEEEEERPTESEKFKIAEDYGSAVVPEEFPRTLVIAISTHGTIRSDKPEKFTIPQGITLVKVNAVIPSVCNVITSEDMKSAADFITEEVDKFSVLDTKDLLILASEIRDHIVKKVKGSVVQADAYVREKKKAGEFEDLSNYITFLNNFARGYRVIDVTGQQMLNKHYSRENKDALNSVGDWQIKALNVHGQPDLINEVERANGRRSTRSTDAETSFEELINFCIEKGARRFLVFDFSCANVADENRDPVFSTERDRRNFVINTLDIAYGGKTKKIKQKSRKTLKKRETKKSKKMRSQKITRRRKRNRK